MGFVSGSGLPRIQRWGFVVLDQVITPKAINLSEISDSNSWKCIKAC
jgi:hypothetical protein